MKYTEVYRMRKSSVQQPTYALKQGENPAVLDRRFGFKSGTIASLNPGLDYNKLQIGQQLNMPSSWKQPSYYTISSGDTMRGLDKRYKLPIGSFQKANPGLNYNRLRVGQRITMPKMQKMPVFTPKKAPVVPKKPEISTFQPSKTQKYPIKAQNKQLFKPTSDYNVNGAMMQQSLNGKYTQGDIKAGKPYSIGPLQIRQVYPKERAAYLRRRRGKNRTFVPVIDDVNDRYGTSYTAQDRKNVEKSRQIYKLYSDIYSRSFYKKFGRNPTDAERWKIWNGGPRGYRNPKTQAYVQAILAKYANPGKWGLTPGVIYTPPKKNKTQR